MIANSRRHGRVVDEEKLVDELFKEIETKKNPLNNFFRP